MCGSDKEVDMRNQEWMSQASNSHSWAANIIIREVSRKSGVDRQFASASLATRLFRRRNGGRSLASWIVLASVFVTACAIVMWPGRSDAQATCREGKAVGGQCVTEGLAEMTRQMAVIFSQPKISHTAFPVMPSADARYRYPNELIPTPLKPSAVGTPAPN
jgi:hypothetical protein